jgi:hypothetical protein
VDASFLPGLIGYLTKHSEVTQSLTVGVAAAVAVIVALFLRLLLRTTVPRTDGTPASVAALDVVIWPLVAIVAITVVERFRILS